MKNIYIEPEVDKEAFTCPNCGVIAKQIWSYLFAGKYHMSQFRVCCCEHCNKYSIWLDENDDEDDPNYKMIYPANSNLPEPNDDLPDDIKKIYIEAKNVYNQSPRAACALLRLAIEKLCVFLGGKGDNLNNDIAELVKKGLASDIQRALDIVRVTGNDAVHPGQINIEDNLEMSTALFSLVNIIAEKLISDPKRIEELYSKLPQEKIEQIKKRDNRN